MWFSDKKISKCFTISFSRLFHDFVVVFSAFKFQPDMWFWKNIHKNFIRKRQLNHWRSLTASALWNIYNFIFKRSFCFNTTLTKIFGFASRSIFFNIFRLFLLNYFRFSSCSYLYNSWNVCLFLFVFIFLWIRFLQQQLNPMKWNAK